MRFFSYSFSFFLLVFFSASSQAQDLSKPDLSDQPDPAHVALLSQVDAVLAVISEQRGIPATDSVQSDVLTRSELLARLIEEINEEYPEDLILADQRFLRALSLLGPEQDYLQLSLDLLEEQVAGFYDDDLATFYLIDDSPIEMQVAVMSHELFHAIQDQTWDLTQLRGRAEHISDIALARTALIEGDAVAVMLNYSAGGALDIANIPMLDQMMSASIEPPNEEFPLTLWESLVYPYIEGLSFVLALYRAGGWEMVNNAYTHLPNSTEQILHPERYLNLDEPTWLSFEATDELIRYNEDIIGEFGIASMFRQLLGNSLSERAINRATDGWDGDRINAYRFADQADRDMMLWLSVWDSNGDAEAFYRVATRLSSVWTEEATESEKIGEYGESILFSGTNSVLYLEHWGDLVLVALDRGGNADSLERNALLERQIVEIWETHRRASYPDLRVMEEK